jgi:hypothetical protein
VARWDFQERARLILPNEDGGCKSFLRNLATPLLEPARQVPWGRSQVSQIRTKREIRQYPSNRELLFESDYADEALASILSISEIRWSGAFEVRQAMYLVRSAAGIGSNPLAVTGCQVSDRT